jgi:hypothetical protein
MMALLIPFARVPINQVNRDLVFGLMAATNGLLEIDINNT